MATVSYAFFSSVIIGTTNDLHSGGVHNWSMWGGDFNYGDAIMVTAHPIGRPGVALAVEQVRIHRGITPTTLSFAVKNVGTETVIGYGLGFAWVDQ